MVANHAFQEAPPVAALAPPALQADVLLAANDGIQEPSSAVLPHVTPAVSTTGRCPNGR